LKNKALKLAAQGFRVFPIKVNTKDRPLIKDYLNKATTDTVQVEEWWSKWPDANIGVAPGPTHLVIDIDAYKPEAKKSAKLLDPPVTFTVKTPRGGYHLYYIHPGGGIIGNDNKEWREKFPGIEIRADKGYVLGPGSSVGGRSYEALERRQVADKKGRAGKPTSLPPAIIKHLPYKDKTWQAAPKTVIDVLSQPSVVKLPVIIKAGERDNTMFSYICSLVAQGLSHSEIVEKSKGVFQRCEQPQADPFPWATVESMIDRAMGEYGELAAVELATTPAPPGSVLQAAIDRYVLVSDGNFVVDLAAHPRSSVLKLDHWKTTMKNVWWKKKQLPGVWLVHRDRKTAFGTTYYPGEQKVFNRNGHDYYNTFIPPDLKPLKGDNYDGKQKGVLDSSNHYGDPRIFGGSIYSPFIATVLEHLCYLFEDDSQNIGYFISWVAYTVRYQPTRIPWAPIIVSSYPGVGKGWIFHLLQVLLGVENCFRIDPIDLSESKMNFNEWWGGTLLCLDEVDPRLNFIERLKPIITETYGTINPKYGRKESRGIYCNLIAFSNHADALKLDPNDRRWWVIHTTVKPKSPGYYVKLFDWLKTDGPGYFLQYLLDFDLSKFNHAAPPPVTKAKKVMIADSRSEIERCVHDAVDLKTGPFAHDIVDTEVVRPYVQQELHMDRVTFADKQTIGRALEKVCKHDPLQFTVKLLNGQSRRRRLKIIRNPAKWKKAAKDEIVAEYMRALEGAVK
jgi:hypothetical protein